MGAGVNGDAALCARSGLSAEILAAANRLLPEPGSDVAETRKGVQSETEFAQSWITGLTREAERANNQL